MNNLNPTQLLRALRGAPLAVLVALVAQAARTPTDASRCTGYSRKSCHEAYEILRSLGLAIPTPGPHGQRAGWRAADEAYQLSLWPDAASAESTPVLVVNKETEQTIEEEEKETHIPTHTHTITEDHERMLISLGCSPEKARQACQDHGDTELGEDIAGWIEYCNSEAGATIRQPGYLIASRISMRIPPPPVPKAAHQQAQTTTWATEDEKSLFFDQVCPACEQRMIIANAGICPVCGWAEDDDDDTDYGYATSEEV